MDEAMWFFAGAVCFQILAKLFGYVQLITFTSETGLHMLRLCANILHDVSFMQTLKYQQLRESGVEETQIRLVKDIDEETISNWKESVILKFKQTLPRGVRAVFTFKDWNGAMQMLNQHLKRER
jgi:hypothetical protein